MRLNLLLSILLFQSCKSTKIANEDLCSSVDSVLIELASNLSKYNNSNCYKFTFDKDSVKYLEYSKYHKLKNFDYKLNETVFFQVQLTDQIKAVSDTTQNCISHYSKNDIVKLFGKPTDINKYYNFYNYQIVTSKICSACVDSSLTIEHCGNYIKFYFDNNMLSRIVYFIYSP